MLILATLTLKRRHLSVKRRQLVLTDSAASADGCRLFYVDPDTMEVKGAIPWSPQLHAELMPRGQFRVHTPGRTYYLEEVVGDVECAELWVKTITKLQARLAASSWRGAALDVEAARAHVMETLREKLAVNQPRVDTRLDPESPEA